MRIGEVAVATGLNTKTIRFYEDRGLLAPPPRTPNGYRDYPPQTTARLEFIRGAQSAGLTLVQIGSVLSIRDAGDAPCIHVTELINTHLVEIAKRLAELQDTYNALELLAERAEGTDPAECSDQEICSILQDDHSR